MDGIRLSLIIGARNDAFTGNFQWRLGTTLNFIATSLQKIGRLSDVEVVVCDWGSQVPLHQVLQLSSPARQITHFVIVPPDLAAEKQKDSIFPIPIVQNVAIRRCRGTYIAQTDSDVIFTPLAMERLLMILDRRLDIGIDPDQALLVASRKHIPFEFCLCEPSHAEVEEYLHLYGAMLPCEPLIPGIGTPSALALMHRRLWEELGGYDERYIYWGYMEIDLYIRVNQRYPWQDGANAGVILYHLEHYPNNDRTNQTRKYNRPATPDSFQVNGHAWGLAEKRLEICKAQKAADETIANKGSCARRLRLFSKMYLEQISTMLNDDALCWHVRQIDNFIMPSNAKPRYHPIEAYEWGYREALVWYAQQLNPLGYLEIGLGYSAACLFVAAQFPPVSIYGLWVRPPGTRQWAQQLPNQMSEMLNKSGHRGYLRHMYALDQAQVSRLLKENLKARQHDLIFVHPRVQSVVTTHQLPELVHNLSDGGAIVWPCADPKQLLKRLSMQTIAKELVLLPGHEVLLILKAAKFLKPSPPAFSALFHDTQSNRHALKDLAQIQDVMQPRTGKPLSARYHYAQALKYYEQKDAVKALACFKQAVYLQPHLDEYRKCLGQLYITVLHDPLNALIQFFHACRISPDDPEPRRIYDHILSVLENWSAPN